MLVANKKFSDKIIFILEISKKTRRDVCNAMLKLLVIADDFTGALDTGVQFSSRGAKTKVITDPQYDLSLANELDVLVLDSETRHLASERAYEIVNNFVKRVVSRFSNINIYKKTDSGLRGNIGSELSAAMDALNFDKMAFIPAFPAMNRVTKNSIHYGRWRVHNGGNVGR